MMLSSLLETCFNQNFKNSQKLKKIFNSFILDTQRKMRDILHYKIVLNSLIQLKSNVSRETMFFFFLRSVLDIFVHPNNDT